MIIASREPTLLTLLLVAGCRAAAPPISPSPVPAAAPTEMSHTRTAESTPDTGGGQRAAVKFMQGMIAHHAQALVMTDLLKTRTASETMRLLAQRIDISQKDEIAMMQRWLREHGAEAPDHDAHHHMATGHQMLMP